MNIATELTNRQKEILALISSGYTDKEIALRLEISSATIHNHRSQIISRLNALNIAHAVMIAIRCSFINERCK